MRQLTEKEIRVELRKLSQSEKIEAVGYSEKIKARLNSIKEGGENFISSKYVGEMVNHAMQGPFTDLMKLDALNRLRRDFVRNGERGKIDDLPYCLKVIDDAIGKLPPQQFPDEEEAETEEPPFSYHQVSVNQDKNQNIIENILPDIDANIDELYPEADAPSRVAAYLAAFESAMTTHVSKKFKISRKEARKYAMAFYDTLITVDKLLDKKGKIEEKFPDITGIAKKFSDQCERKN